MAVIAMYSSYRALEASVGKPFRFINTKTTNRTLPTRQLYVYAPGPTMSHPDWIAHVLLDGDGKLVSAEQLA